MLLYPPLQEAVSSLVEAALDEELTRLRAAVSAERRAASELHGEAAALKRELSSYEARVAKGATAPFLISGVDGVTDGKENEARIVEDAAVLVAAATKLQPLMQKADGLVTKVSEADETPEAVEAEIARRRAVLGGLGVGALEKVGLGNAMLAKPAGQKLVQKLINKSFQEIPEGASAKVISEIINVNVPIMKNKIIQPFPASS